MKKVMLLIVVVCLASGCANKRFYIGFDDYGDTVNHETSWQTGNSDRRGK